MALSCELSLNGNRIGFVSARRVVGCGIRPESLNTYAVVVERTDGLRWEGEIRHRHGDGEWALVQRALDAAGDLSAEEVAVPQEVRSGHQ